MRKKRYLSGNTKGVVRRAVSFVEIIAVALLYFAVFRNGYENAGLYPLLGRGKYVLMGLYALISGLFIMNMDGFQFGNLRRFDLAMAQWIGLFATNFITYFQLCLIANKMISMLPMLVLMAMDIVLVVLFVFVYAALFRRLFKPHDMLLVFGSNNAITLKLKMDTRRDKYRINKLISVEKGFEAICEEILKHEAVIINDVPAQIRNDLVKFCYTHNVRTYVVPKITDIILRGGENITTFDTPLLLTHGFGPTITQRIIKRAMDIAICMVAMVVVAPIMIVVAIAIKLEDGGPVFYKQKRMTTGGREFDILKFRSMIVDAEKYAGAVLASQDDPRITKVGKVIRATRLDEIPQILNILKGDMSIVGPRPERKVIAEEYYRDIPEFAYRLKVPSGLTGYAQIYGKYNTTAYDKLRFDLMYIENYSLLLDIKLILMTLRIIFSKESTEGVTTQEEKEERLKAVLEEVHQSDRAEQTKVEV